MRHNKKSRLVRLKILFDPRQILELSILNWQIKRHTAKITGWESRMMSGKGAQSNYGVASTQTATYKNTVLGVLHKCG